MAGKLQHGKTPALPFLQMVVFFHRLNLQECFRSDSSCSGSPQKVTDNGHFPSEKGQENNIRIYLSVYFNFYNKIFYLATIILKLEL